VGILRKFPEGAFGLSLEDPCGGAFPGSEYFLKDFILSALSVVALSSAESKPKNL
jgi:hypothetical protein